LQLRRRLRDNGRANILLRFTRLSRTRIGISTMCIYIFCEVLTLCSRRRRCVRRPLRRFTHILYTYFVSLVIFFLARYVSENIRASRYYIIIMCALPTMRQVQICEIYIMASHRIEYRSAQVRRSYL
jgi:hypothetical protein